MNKVLVIGGINVDFLCKAQSFVKEESNICKTTSSFGGVGRNIVENIARLGVDTTFISSVGSDIFGSLVIDDLKKLNVNTHYINSDSSRTGSYIALLDDNNDMMMAFCDTEVGKVLSKEYLATLIDYINTFKYVVLDANLSNDTYEYLLNNIKGEIFIDATSSVKAKKIIPYLDKITYLKCNILEAKTLVETESNDKEFLVKSLMKKGVKQVIITSSTNPIYYNDNNIIKYKQVNPVAKELIKSTTGCGDAFMSGIIYAIVNQMSIDKAVEIAQSLSSQTLEVTEACNKNLRLK